MHRPLLRTPFRSIADSLCKSKFHEHGRRNAAEKLEFSRTLTTSLGYEFLGEESTTKLMQMQIIDALRRGERSRASHLLLNLGHGNHSLGVTDFFHILNYCARSPDPLFVMETWRMMEDKEIGLNNTSYLLMMQALCKGGYLEEASNLINFLGESHGIYPILPVYNCFLGACARMQSMIHANLCLELMDSKMVGKNEVTYTELLKLAVWQQNLSAVHDIWKDYIKHYSLSIFPLRKFIWSFTRLRDLKSAYEALQHMVALAMTGRLYINRTSEGKLYSSRLDIPIPLNGQLNSQKVEFEDSDHSLALKTDTCIRNSEQDIIFNMGISKAECVKIGMMNAFKSLPVMKVLRWSFSDVIHACAQTRDSGLAEQLMLQMQRLGLQPSSHTYDVFIRAIVSDRGFSYGMEVLNVMQQQNLKPYDSTLATLSIKCSKALELDLAEALLDQISECPYPQPFNIFLAACDAMDQPERAVKILAKMKQLSLRPDIMTYELLFSLFGNVNAPYEEGNMLSQVDCAKRINAIEMDMTKNNVQHSHLSMKNLLKALGAEGMTRELIQYLDMAENLFRHSNTFVETPIYNTVLHSLVEARESHRAIEIFKNMKSFGVPLDAATYNIMINCCSIIRCFKSARALVSMMVRDGFYPQTMTYTALIKILLEYEDFDEALNMLDQVSSEGNQLDVLLYNTILQKACEKGRIDVVEFIIEQMHRNKVQPDPSTCLYVFSGYVDRGFHSTAMEALQVLSMRMLCEDEDSGLLQDRRSEFEDLIHSEDVEAESQILQFFKDSGENLAAALLHLRWCAIAGFPISWSLDQSQWAKRLSTNYDTRRKS
ncbi:Pentatricopeptide repeat [Melia azedarach]|uniref:Pentatricopeptide repeat n=1 Tax=Melia azedarach TaxID=155640 RepID=A0ACC1Y343_MELAZ|nr:Pentatricopeptide repeat [Melia azedarach]